MIHSNLTGYDQLMAGNCLAKEMDMITIRTEEPADYPTVHVINEQAFGQPAEADLVDTLRTVCPEYLSLVAAIERQVVGHILFTPVTTQDAGNASKGMGLAPMAVLPEFQRQGVGSALVEHGLARLRADGCPFVIVLGHPEYYPRFGFQPASRFDLRCQWDGVPDAAFMVQALAAGALDGIEGVVRYRDEFDTAM